MLHIILIIYINCFLLNHFSNKNYNKSFPLTNHFPWFLSPLQGLPHFLFPPKTNLLEGIYFCCFHSLTFHFLVIDVWLLLPVLPLPGPTMASLLRYSMRVLLPSSFLSAHSVLLETSASLESMILVSLPPLLLLCLSLLS